MPSFYAGDELGTIKHITYTKADKNEWKADVRNVHEGSSGKAGSIQKMALSLGDRTLLSTVRADGSASAFAVKENTDLEVLHEWKESRMKSGQRYVGLAMSNNSVYTCTSNGALRLTQLVKEDPPLPSQVAVLPMRLFDWRISHDQEAFACGGDEVELSVWNTEQAFIAPKVDDASLGSESKKRKRSDQLLPGEIWRAKNLPNDNLNLRQPVHNTALTFLNASSSSSGHHLAVGTRLGNVRQYDTRAARRPVADWKDTVKVGGVSALEKGFAEHELFVSDYGCSVFAIDLRNGKTVYGYKSISGAVSSIAPSPTFLASVSQDRYLRLHSTFPPPPSAGQRQDRKGEVLDKLYMKVTPTVVLWDQKCDEDVVSGGVEGEEDGEDVWDELEEVESDVEEAENERRGKKSRATQ